MRRETSSNDSSSLMTYTRDHPSSAAAESMASLGSACAALARASSRFIRETLMAIRRNVSLGTCSRPTFSSSAKSSEYLTFILRVTGSYTFRPCVPVSV